MNERYADMQNSIFIAMCSQVEGLQMAALTRPEPEIKHNLAM
jgi:hypothetical protein